MVTALISIYTEYSTKGHPFKPRKDYDIDWKSIIDISHACGMLSTVESNGDSLICRHTTWSRYTSYDEWTNNQYVKEYLMQRNAYNRKHLIISNLSFIYIP